MRTEWFMGLLIAAAWLVGVPVATADEASTAASASSPFAAMEPLSAAEMSAYAGGADTFLVEQGSLMVNSGTAVGTSIDNALSNVTAGFISGTMVNSNSGFTTVVNNTGSAAAIAVNTSVTINLQ